MLLEMLEPVLMKTGNPSIEQLKTLKSTFCATKSRFYKSLKGQRNNLSAVLFLQAIFEAPLKT